MKLKQLMYGKLTKPLELAVLVRQAGQGTYRLEHKML